MIVMRIESDPTTVTQFFKISYTAVSTVHIGKNKGKFRNNVEYSTLSPLLEAEI
jgi:hypothetical protein